MFQVEQRFERSMINFEGQEPPIRHYPIAEVVAGHLVFTLSESSQSRNRTATFTNGVPILWSQRPGLLRNS